MAPDTPAPTPDDLHDALEAVPDGPNIEADPDALKAAKGEVPLEGPHAGDVPATDTLAG